MQPLFYHLCLEFHDVIDKTKKRVLHFLLSWKVYRTFKNGLLLDFITKRFFFRISKYFFYIFTIFFGDKFILEHFFSNFFIFFSLISVKVKYLNRNSFINFFKLTIFIISYFSIVAMVIFL